MHPKPSSDIGNSISNIVEWEDKWTRMAKKFPSVPILRKMTVLMEVCPADVQDMVCQAIDDVHEDYERLELKILSWVSNMMSIRHGLVLMDIMKTEHFVACTERDTDAHFLVSRTRDRSHQTHMRLVQDLWIVFVPCATQKPFVQFMFHGTLFESQFSTPPLFLFISVHTISDFHTKSDGRTISGESFSESELQRNSARRHAVWPLGPNKTLLHVMSPTLPLKSAGSTR